MTTPAHDSLETLFSVDPKVFEKVFIETLRDAKSETGSEKLVEWILVYPVLTATGAEYANAIKKEDATLALRFETILVSFLTLLELSQELKKQVAESN